MTGLLRIAILLCCFIAFVVLLNLKGFEDATLGCQPFGFRFAQQSSNGSVDNTMVEHKAAWARYVGKDEAQSPQHDDNSKPTCGSKDLLFNVGQGRTGTTTMDKVVALLGYKSVHGFQQVNVQEVHDFMKDPKNVTASNVFADLVTQAGVPAQKPFDWTERWPPRGTAFHDVPFFGMPCELYERYPKAKFFMLDKDEVSHAQSVIFMYCACDCSYNRSTTKCKQRSHCDLFLRGERAGIQRNELRRFLWGEAYSGFCENASRICIPPQSASKGNAQYKHTLQLLVDSHRQHLAKVRSCIPAESLFHTDRVFTDFSRTLAEFVAFLGCKPKVPLETISLPKRR